MPRNLKSFSSALVVLERIKPYMQLMRLHRPIGIYLCLCPALWSLSLASARLPYRTIAFFTLGALLVRGAGCTINDIIDRDLDKKVRRTQTRPLAVGLISRGQALFFLGAQLLGALYILLSFNFLTILLGISIVIPIFLYPFFKRFTYWPQIFLGLVFNWGVLMAWGSIQGTLSVIPLLLYVVSVFWTIGYDTVYAFQDYEDDVKNSIKSSAIRVGYNKGKTFLMLCYLSFFAGLMGVSWMLKKPFLTGFFFLISLFVGIKTCKLSLGDPTECQRFFLLNGNLGFLIWAGILLSNFIYS